MEISESTMVLGVRLLVLIGEHDLIVATSLRSAGSAESVIVALVGGICERLATIALWHK